METRFPKADFQAKRILIYHDVENCPVTSAYKGRAMDLFSTVTSLVWKNLTGQTDTRGIPSVLWQMVLHSPAMVQTFSASRRKFLPTDKFLAEVSSLSHIFTLIDPGSAANAVDRKIQEELQRFYNDPRRDSVIVLISGDSDYTPYLDRLRSLPEGERPVIVVFFLRAKSTIKDVADILLSWEDVVGPVENLSGGDNTSIGGNAANNNNSDNRFMTPPASKKIKIVGIPSQWSSRDLADFFASQAGVDLTVQTHYPPSEGYSASVAFGLARPLDSSSKKVVVVGDWQSGKGGKGVVTGRGREDASAVEDDNLAKLIGSVFFVTVEEKTYRISVWDASTSNTSSRTTPEIPSPQRIFNNNNNNNNITVNNSDDIVRKALFASDLVSKCGQDNSYDQFSRTTSTSSMLSSRATVLAPAPTSSSSNTLNENISSSSAPTMSSFHVSTDNISKSRSRHSSFSFSSSSPGSVFYRVQGIPSIWADGKLESFVSESFGLQIKVHSKNPENDSSSCAICSTEKDCMAARELDNYEARVERGRFRLSFKIIPSPIIELVLSDVPLHWTRERLISFFYENTGIVLQIREEDTDRKAKTVFAFTEDRADMVDTVEEQQLFRVERGTHTISVGRRLMRSLTDNTVQEEPGDPSFLKSDNNSSGGGNIKVLVEGLPTDWSWSTIRFFFINNYNVTGAVKIIRPGLVRLSIPKAQAEAVDALVKQETIESNSEDGSRRIFRLRYE